MLYHIENRYCLQCLEQRRGASLRLCPNLIEIGEYDYLPSMYVVYIFQDGWAVFKRRSDRSRSSEPCFDLGELPLQNQSI